jgi:hypothetical protein
VLYVSSPDGQENIKEQEEVKNEKKREGKERKKKRLYQRNAHLSFLSRSPALSRCGAHVKKRPQVCPVDNQQPEE